MRRLGGTFLAALLAVSVVSGACGDDDESSDDEPAITQTTIGVTQTSVAPTSSSIARTSTTGQ